MSTMDGMTARERIRLIESKRIDWAAQLSDVQQSIGRMYKDKHVSGRRLAEAKSRERELVSALATSREELRQLRDDLDGGLGGRLNNIRRAIREVAGDQAYEQIIRRANSYDSDRERAASPGSAMPPANAQFVR